MKILMTGTGNSGSWRIRGEQLGAAIGADVIPRATEVNGYEWSALQYAGAKLYEGGKTPRVRTLVNGHFYIERTEVLGFGVRV